MPEHGGIIQLDFSPFFMPGLKVMGVGEEIIVFWYVGMEAVEIVDCRAKK